MAFPKSRFLPNKEKKYQRQTIHRKGDTNRKRNVVFIVIGVLLTCVIIAILGRVSQNYWGDKRFASKEEFQAFAQKEQVVLEDQGYFAIKKNGRTILGYPTQDGYIWDEFPFQPNNCKVLADHNSKKEFSLQDAWMDVSLCAQIDNKDIFNLFSVRYYEYPFAYA